MARKGRRWGTLAAGAMLGALATWFVTNYHLVRSSAGWLFIPRSEVGLADPYADVRGWQADDWQRHPGLTRAVVKAGRTDILPPPPRTPSLADWWRRLFPQATRPPSESLSR